MECYFWKRSNLHYYAIYSIYNNDPFSSKLEDVPETDITSGNKELDTKYNIVLLQRIALKSAKFSELYKEITKILVSSVDVELEDNNTINEVRIEKDLLLAIWRTH